MMYFHVSYIARYSTIKIPVGETILRLKKPTNMCTIREMLAKDMGVESIVILSISPLTRRQYRFLTGRNK